jgi:hypothetical protein
MLSQQDLSIASYYQLKELILSYAIHIHPTDLNNIFGYAIAYCLRLVNAGNKDYLHEYLFWTEQKIQYGLLLEGGEILPITFRNIVRAGFSCRQPDWVKSFIENYSKHVPAKSRESILQYCWGMYYFETGNFKKAGQMLSQTYEDRDIIQSAITKRLMLKCHFEYNKKDIPVLKNQVEAFNTFLKRHESELGGTKTIFRLFSKYFSLLITRQDSARKITMALEQLEQEPFFPGKDWLEKKMNLFAKKQIVMRA